MEENPYIEEKYTSKWLLLLRFSSFQKLVENNVEKVSFFFFNIMTYDGN